MQKQVARILLENKAVTLSLDPPYTYASGIKSPIYCDNRVLISIPQAREAVVEAYLQTIQKEHFEFDCVAGTATAGIAWAAWISDRLTKPMVYIRSSAKGHGKENQIEGRLQAGQKVLVIEDLVSTGGSSIKAVQAVQEQGHEVVAALSVFTYQMKKAKAVFDTANVPLYPLSSFSVLIDEAVAMGIIKEDQQKLVMEWNRDPENWGV